MWGLHSRSALHRTVTRPAQLLGYQSLKTGLTLVGRITHHDVNSCTYGFRRSESEPSRRMRFLRCPWIRAMVPPFAPQCSDCWD